MNVTPLKEVKEEVVKIKIGHDYLSETPIDEAIKKVMNAQGLPQRTAYWFGKSGSKFLKAAKKSQDEFWGITKEFCEKDEKGNPKFVNPYEVKIPDDKKEAYNAKKDAFLKEGFELEIIKFPMADFQSAKLTPAELVALEPFFSDAK